MHLVRLILLVTFLAASFSNYGQNKEIADSCLNVLAKGKIENDSVRFALLLTVAYNQIEPDSVIFYSDHLIEQAQAKKNSYFLTRGYYCKSIGLNQKSDNAKAIELLIMSLNTAQNDESSQAVSYSQMGNIYISMDNPAMGIKCYRQAIQIFEKKNNKVGLSNVSLNLGSAYLRENKQDSALIFYKFCDSISTITQNEISAAYAKGNIGIILAKQSNYDAAAANLKVSCQILQKKGHHQAFISFALWLSIIEMKMNNNPNALFYANECLFLAKRYNLKEQIRDSYEQLSKIYETQGRYKESNAALRNYYSYNDSIINTETITKIANLRTEFEVGQKQAELDAMTEKEHFKTRLAWALSLGFAVVVVLLVAVYRNFRTNNRLARQLGNQKQQLETANHTKDRFFSVISHDLRGPIGSLGNLAVLAQAATQEGNNEDTKQYLSLLEQHTKNVEALLDNLLHWSVSQKGAYQIHKELVDINELIKGIIDIYLPIASAKGIELLYPNPQKGLTVAIDVNSWAVILRNLINNALKFTHIGGKVEIKASLASNSLEIEVRDTGVGMDKQTKESLFTTPVNQPQWGTQNEKGMGIGLSLVKDFVELNQGTVYLESEVGKGTAFRVTVPL